MLSGRWQGNSEYQRRKNYRTRTSFIHALVRGTLEIIGSEFYQNPGAGVTQQKLETQKPIHGHRNHWVS